jgi:hypothetical protein
MKFTDGQWLYQPGVIAHYAAEARSIASADGKLVVERSRCAESLSGGREE